MVITDSGSTTPANVHLSAMAELAPQSSQKGLTDDSSTSGKTVKLPPSMIDRRLAYRIIIKNVDFTPDDISDPEFISMDETFTHAAYDIKSRTKSEAGIIYFKISRTKSKTAGVLDSAKVYATTINLDDIHIDHTLNTEEGLETEDGDLSIAPSAFYLPKMYPVTSYPPEISIILKETETVFLFEIPCLSYDKGTIIGTAVEEDNAYYEYITVGKGRNRKMVNQETQTKSTITQTRHTQAIRPQKKNAMSFASMWDMHDTYARLAKKMEKEEDDEMVMYQSASPRWLRKRKKKIHEISQGKTFDEIAATPQYLDAVLLTERVLASIEYGNAQKIFRGLVAVDPLSLDLVYIYTLKPLWTFECEETAGKPLVYMSINTKNPNIIASGYGKYGYADACKGLICVWCNKNPCKPERLYRFNTPVTCCNFSEKNPNFLACGFANGDVIILDVTSYDLKILAQSKRESNPCFEPIWMIRWPSADRETEYVMTTCEDGRINRLQSTKTHEFICTPMMRICAVEGKLRGLETPKTCLRVDVPITRYPAALCLRWHPTIDHHYLVGTDEGCVHRCSTSYVNQHIDVFRAHSGPVIDMCASPFMSSLLATCGADSAIRLWMEGIDDVIITLVCPCAVNGIAFCPINATILLSVSGNVLSVWDLRRKIHMPCAEYTFAANVILTYIRFATGHNVLLGDTLGRAHTFHLEDTPIQPFFQKKLLEEVLRKALCTRPHLVKRFDKIIKMKNQRARTK